MARPALALPDRVGLLALVDAEGRLAVRVTPGARTQSLEIVDDRVAVKVRAKAQDGKANEAVRDVLAQALGVAPTKLELLRGAASRDKLFRVSG